MLRVRLRRDDTRHFPRLSFNLLIMKFYYQARTKEGRSQKGVIEASSQKSAIEVLEKYGLFITSLEDDKSRGFLNKEIIFKSRVSRKDILMFARQVGAMLKSAISPLETLRTQVAQIGNSTLREQILGVAEALETGSTLSQAFGLYPKTFNDFFVSIIKAGEATGKVADSFVYLADHLEQDYNFRQKLISAMVYPCFVVAVFLGSGLIVVFFILPRLSEMFENMSGNLPMVTRVLIVFSVFMRKGGWVYCLAFFVCFIVVFALALRNPKSRRFLSGMLLNVPVVGGLLKKIYLTRFAENLSVLIRSGLPITQALKITREIVRQEDYREIIERTESRVARGEMISSVLVNYPKYFPPFVTQMVSTGEETGRLEKTLMDVVSFYRAEVERTTEKLPTIIEPVLIITLGVAVGFMAFAVFIPLFQVGLSGG